MSARENDEPQFLARLRVDTEADPGALPRVLAHFHTLNLVPRRVLAEFGADTLHISIDVFGMSEHRLTTLTAKLDQIPTVLKAFWHRR